MSARRGVVGFLAAALLGVAGLRADAAPGVASVVEDEFEAAIKAVSPAAVFCVASGAGNASPGSSGVLISRDGWVLSDGDAGAFFRPKPGGDGRREVEKAFADVVEVRVPDLKRKTWVNYAAKRVKRVEAIDSSLLKIEKPPSGGFPFVAPGASAHLEVGHFTFAVGTSFPNGEGDGDASLTAGVVAHAVPLAAGDPGGRWAELYTSAAVNPGVNGGPLVDADGALVGIISSWVEPSPESPYQFLGKAFPIDRVRNAYRDVPGAEKVFPDPKTLPVRAKQTALLEQALGATARRVASSVVSLEVTRKSPVATKLPQASLRRYAGPTSAVVVSRDGFLVASLYALADVVTIAVPQVLPGRDPGADVAADLASVEAVRACFPDGKDVAAKVVAHDQRLGIVLLKAELPDGYATTPLEPAPAGALRPGRLVLGVANPFGRTRSPDPLTTLGMLSRVHPDGASDAWGGCFQTDANQTDGTVGGALVDVRGRLLGVATLWFTPQHGRNSGIGFGVPWPAIEAQLSRLRSGTSFLTGSGVMQIVLRSDGQGATVGTVSPGGPAAKAGIQAGDRILAVGTEAIADGGELHLAMRRRRPGEAVELRVLRDGKELKLSVVLAKRDPPPAPKEPAPAMSDAPASGEGPPMGDAPPAMEDAPSAMGDAPAMEDAPPPMGDAPPEGTPPGRG